MSTLNEFISTIKTQGLARSNRFSVNIPFKTWKGGDPRTVLILCDQAALPGITIASTQQRIWGELREMPYEALFEPVTFSFYVDTNLGVKNLFEEWIQLVRDPESRVFNYYSNYTADINIYVHPLDENDMPVHTVTLYEAYPKSLQAINLDYSSKDVMKYSVTMNYKWYTTSSMTKADVTNELSNPSDIIPSILTSNQ